MRASRSILHRCVLSTALVSASLLVAPAAVQAQCSATGGAAQSDLKRWVALFENANLTQLINELQQRLDPPNPHDLAPLLLWMAHDAKGDLKAFIQFSRLSTTPVVLRDYVNIKSFCESAVGRNVSNDYTGKTPSQLSWSARIELGSCTMDPSRALAIWESLAKQNPSDFLAARGILEAIANPKARQLWLADVTTEPRLRAEPLHSFITSASSSDSRLARLRAVDNWLSTVNNDVFAREYRATLLSELERWEAAAEEWKAVDDCVPFRWAWRDTAVAMLRAGKESKAKAVVERQARRWKNSDFPDDQGDLGVSRRWLSTLVSAGEKGRARDQLEIALQKWPKARSLLQIRIDLESDKGHFGAARAEPFARRLAEDATDPNAQATLVNILRRVGKLAEARHFLEHATQTFNDPPSSLLLAGLWLAAAEKRYGDRLDFARRLSGAGGYYQADLALALWESGSRGEALRVVRQICTSAQTSQWAFETLLKWSTQVNGSEAATAEFDALAKSSVDNFDYWVVGAKALSGPTLSSYWERLTMLHPGKANYFIRYHDALLRDPLGKLRAPASADSSRRLAEQFGTDEDIIEAIDEQIRTRIALADNGMIQADATSLRTSFVDEMRARGAPEARWLARLASIRELTAKPEEARDTFVRYTVLRPDDSFAIVRLFQGISREVRQPQRWKLLNRYLNRDPFDSERIIRAAQYHIQWGGSPLVGLALLDGLEENDPDAFLESERAIELQSSALATLGAPRTHFEKTYQSADHISPSERYIAWYDAARSAAQDDHNILHLSRRDEYGAVLVRADGSEFEARDDPLFGLPIVRRWGAYTIHAEYDPESLNLTRVYSDKGQDVTIGWDNGRPVRMRTADASLSIAYGIDGGVENVDVDGIGSLSSQSSQPDNSVAPGTTSTTAHRIITDVLTLATRLASRDTESPIELAKPDQTVARLERSYDQAATERRAVAGVALAKHLLEHVHDNGTNGPRAKEVVEIVFELGRKLKAPPSTVRAGVEAVSLWLQLAKKMQPTSGEVPLLDRAGFLKWAEMCRWLDDLGKDRHAPVELAAVIYANKETPPALLPAARWYLKSPLSIDGYWRRFPPAEVLPRPLRGARLQAVLVRRNGELVVGTNRGLAVRSAGSWTWYGVDEKTSTFSTDLEVGELASASDILALAEDVDGGLWAGTSGGLLYIPGPYAGMSQRWRVPGDGMPSPRAEKVVPDGHSVLVATPRGLVRMAPNGPIPVPSVVAREAILLLASPTIPKRKPEPPAESEGVVLVGTKSGLYAIKGGHGARLRGPVDFAVWSPLERDMVVFSERGILSEFRYDFGSSSVEARVLPDQQNLPQGSIRGLSTMPIGENSIGLAVLTDQGLAIFYDEHFEFVEVKGTDKRAAVLNIDHSDGSALLLTSAGLWFFEAGRIHTDSSGRVYAILNLPDRDVVLVAREDGLFALRQEDPRQVFTHLNIDARFLVRLPNGDIVTNDGHQILKVAVKLQPEAEIELQLLFTARSSVDAAWPVGEVSDVLATSDGTLWVTSGASVFRYEGHQSKEYSWFLDRLSCPAMSEMLSRVVETVDHRIWVIASDEGHLVDHHGIPLHGGVLEWTGNGFKRLGLEEQSKAWFITGYTAIDEQTGFVGTLQGFVRHQANRYQTFDQDLADASYRALRSTTPLLWMGTRGKALGDGTWVFGTAGGLVAWKQGRWFNATRLNWLLPRPSAAGLGGRHVYALETDQKGRLYVGTAVGLLIYDSGGGSTDGFLISALERGALEPLFAMAEEEKLRRQTEALLPLIPLESPAGKKIAAINQEQRMINQLDSELEQGATLPNAAVPGKNVAERLTTANGRDSPSSNEPHNTAESSERSAIRKEKLEREVQRKALLDALAIDNPALYQSLDLKPLQLEGLRAHLTEGQYVVQYISGPASLLIHVVSRDDSIVIERYVTAQALREHAARVSAGLADIARHASLLSERVGGQPELVADLQWLYDELLAPVDALVAGAKELLIAPSGVLASLPYAAFIRSGGETPQYAVQRYDRAILPSLYHLELRDEPIAWSRADSLVLGNPDEYSLMAAEQEAQTISNLFHPTLPLLLGKDATLENLLRYADGAQLIHLATHARLDRIHPERSWLLLAGDRHLTSKEIMALPLTHARLICLSACETGIGPGGDEFATIARAFAYAGAPSVVATLWKVNDTASRLLVEAFYTELLKGRTRISALAEAQRAALRKDPQLTPAAWAGFVLFGRP